GAPPRAADVAVDGELITEVGRVEATGRREVDAAGLIVTPGFVDVHTHYDGQATWDPVLAPSSLHGVTTVVMGNCGVGFAPIAPGREDWLIGLMEGVEDIPGTALAAGMTWGWESFPEYLDCLQSQPRSINVATLLPHGALRAYVMGERGAQNEPATPADIARMRALVTEAVDAGALGVSTSRTVVHTAIDGRPVPGTFAAEDELLGLAGGLEDAGAGVLELAPAGIVGEDLLAPDREIAWMRRVSLSTGRPISFVLQQNDAAPEHWRSLLQFCTEANAAGAQLWPQVAPRPVMLLAGHQGPLHPFSARPTYLALAHLPLDERVRQLSDPDVRRRILAESDSPDAPPTVIRWSPRRLYRLGDPPDYEPDESQSVAAIAAREGRPAAEVLYDLMLHDGGRELIMKPGLNYSHGNLDAVYDMLMHPAAVVGGSDGGAHCGIICDASAPTSLLTHWTRDRTRGPRLPLEVAVNLQTRRTATAFGLLDRGMLAPGMRADINLIDYEGLRLHRPEMIHDLPAGARRLMQRATGYVCTMVNGRIAFDNGVPTEERPGRLVRGERVGGVPA
ncbi:MAG: N-acyl-D-aspartate/D-glutamate deacylase, partial [Frankiales bacterium]|nr:N-acyl-D-aspartate/D-glutamate deacylase [Frankiales bacterium]